MFIERFNRKITCQCSNQCLPGSLDRQKVSGKIIFCVQGGGVGKLTKGFEAASAGAIGMILANDQVEGNDIIADSQILPAIEINYADGLAVLAYLNSTK